VRKIWGSVWGEKMWYLLRGIELPEEITTRRSVGHSMLWRRSCAIRPRPRMSRGV
jgi:hypothetical protein